MEKTVRGDYCGETSIDGTTYEVHVNKGNFSLSYGNKFKWFVSKKKLRKNGIFYTFGKKIKKMYGQHGYIGL